MNRTLSRETVLGHCSCHHGEILQGVFRDSDGRPCRGLTTLPVFGRGVRAEFTPDPGRGPEELSVYPRTKTKAAAAAALAGAECRRRDRRGSCGGRIRLTSTVPLGLGMGSSTSDVIATVRAVAAGAGMSLPWSTIAAIAVRAEGASDPLMLDEHALLFAQRQGRVLERFGNALPRVIVVGCVTGGGGTVDTLRLGPGGERDADVQVFQRLRGMLRRAVVESDVELLGRVSTESARHNQRVLPKEELGALEEIAGEVEAAGVQVAHSGNVAGLLFDPDAPELRARLRECVRALNRRGIPFSHLFRSYPVQKGRETWTSTSRTRSVARTWCGSPTGSFAFDSRR
ncbi:MULTISPECIES: GHMP kinase [unclassified Actinopolyspora]|uniref:GHMP family kinase ATP-binding protein n=1 Tax=unclassified Actinopolyspora TaxID=2639451 RepID=UPI0013F62AE1|nr:MULTISPECIES: GHMP kinase [unclassified Actinopolyspora]NHD15935.1 GHMP kinase [Actinopolyspora sp. BKK2]NHE74851.1 GHMP kinase [Actinopolyspora sp. BKK1]